MIHVLIVRENSRTPALMESCAVDRSGGAASRGSRLVALVVAEDAHVRRAMKADLESGGYAVIESQDGFGAMRMCRVLPRLNLLVTDLLLPLVCGRELARQAADIFPGLPVVFLSNYRGDGRRTAARGAKIVMMERPNASR